MRVRALRTGYYDHMRRRGDDTMGEGRGDVFTLEPYEITLVDPVTQVRTGKKILTPEEQFSERWMVKVDDRTPEKTSGAQAALSVVNNQILEARIPGRGRRKE